MMQIRMLVLNDFFKKVNIVTGNTNKFKLPEILKEFLKPFATLGRLSWDTASVLSQAIYNPALTFASCLCRA